MGVQIAVLNAIVAAWVSNAPSPPGTSKSLPFVLANIGLVAVYGFSCLVTGFVLRMATKRNGGKCPSSKQEWAKSQRVRWREMGRAEAACWAGYVLFNVAFLAAVLGLPKAWVLPHPWLFGSIWVLGLLGILWGMAEATEPR